MTLTETALVDTDDLKMRKFYGSAEDDIISYPMIPNMINNNASKFSKLGDFLMFENTLCGSSLGKFVLI